MPITKSAKKALRVDRRRQAINLKIKENLKKVLKTFKKKPTLKNLQKSFSVLDKTAKNGVISKARAGRLKSSLSKQLKLK